MSYISIKNQENVYKFRCSGEGRKMGSQSVRSAATNNDTALFKCNETIF